MRREGEWWAVHPQLNQNFKESGCSKSAICLKLGSCILKFNKIIEQPYLLCAPSKYGIYERPPKGYITRFVLKFYICLSPPLPTHSLRHIASALALILRLSVREICTNACPPIPTHSARDAFSATLHNSRRMKDVTCYNWRLTSKVNRYNCIHAERYKKRGSIDMKSRHFFRSKAANRAARSQIHTVGHYTYLRSVPQ